MHQKVLEEFEGSIIFAWKILQAMYIILMPVLISWYSLHYWMLFSELKIYVCFLLKVFASRTAVFH